MKTRKHFVLFKKEVTEGVDPTPVAGDALKTTNLAPAYYQGNRVSLAYDKGTFGSVKQINANPHTGLSFGLMLSSSGAAGTAPQSGPVIECCGFDETINAGVSVVYSAIDAAIPSATAYYLDPQDPGVDDEKHITSGMRGNMQISLTHGQFPVMTFNFLGSYNTPVEATSVTPSFTGFIDPIPATKVNTPTVTIDGASSCLQSLTHNCNNVLTYENLPGCTEACRITDANYGGNLTIKAPEIADKDFFTDLVESHESISLGAVQVVHGTSAGYIVQIDYTAIQVTGIARVNINGSVGYSMDFLDINNTMTVTFK